MAQIPLQPYPKIPPIGFFEPISISPEDWMTSPEYLMGLLKKLNQVVAQTNKNTEFIDDYSGRIEEIEAEIDELYRDFDSFKQDVTSDMAAQFNAIKIELQAMIATALTQANAYTDAIAGQLRAEIQAISVGNIEVYDPTTGLLSPLQTALDNIYGSSRDGLTATEYDGLELTATYYDGLEITAFDYDMHGKSILIPA